MDSRWMWLERLRKSSRNGKKWEEGFFCCILRLIHRNNQCFSYRCRQAHTPPNSKWHSKWMVLGYKGLFAVCGLCLIEKEDWEKKECQESTEMSWERSTGSYQRRCWCACPPLGNPHPGDHLTDGAFSKLLLSRKRQWQLPRINGIMSKVGDTLKKIK